MILEEMDEEGIEAPLLVLISEPLSMAYFKVPSVVTSETPPTVFILVAEIPETEYVPSFFFTILLAEVTRLYNTAFLPPRTPASVNLSTRDCFTPSAIAFTVIDISVRSARAVPFATDNVISPVDKS